MRFLSIYKTVERNVPPSQEEMAEMGKLIQDGMQAGWLIATEGCLPSALGARVRKAGGNVTVSDGPFTEAKELVGGFAILQANSKEEAIQLCRREGFSESRRRWRVRASPILRGAAASQHTRRGQILQNIQVVASSRRRKDTAVARKNDPASPRTASSWLASQCIQLRECQPETRYRLHRRQQNAIYDHGQRK